MAGNPLLNQMNNSNFLASIQNSPIMKMAQMLKGGQNPQTMLQQMMGGNSQMGQIMNMVQGKSPSEMGAMINDLSKQRGVNVKDLISALGIPNEEVNRLGLNI